MIPAVSLSANITVTTNTTVTSAVQTRKFKISNSTVKSLCKSGKLDEALHLIQSFPSKPITSEQHIDGLSSFLHVCISKRSLEHGQRLLHFLLSTGRETQHILNNPTLKSKFITLYSVCGQVDEARRIFELNVADACVPEEVWLAMAIGYSRNGYSKEALLVYCEMLSRFVQPGNYAFSAALKACAEVSDLLLGRALHAQIVKHEEEADQVVNNALLRLYAECGCYDEVVRVFEAMPQRDVVSWNSLIACYADRGQVFNALDAFRIMQIEGIGFSWITLTTILPICARLTVLNSGKEIHSQIIKSTRKSDIPLLNSLMDMYAKCGSINYCRGLFDRMLSKDLTSWNTMLTGYAVNGLMKEATLMFDEMVNLGIRPDGITFVALLSGCSHSGLTDTGQRFFRMMKEDYRMKPSLEHYACLVDILGRAGRINDALAVVKKMPMAPSGSIWGSLLNSCRLHGNVSLAETVAGRLFELEPDNPGNYVILSNIYAKAERWECVKKVREMMAVKGMKKEVGCSWIQMNNRFYTFVAGGSSELRSSNEYMKVWKDLQDATEKHGYVPDTSVILHDVNEEMKAAWVCGHSERIATVFSLVHSVPGLPIRITKNLRVCVDCHSWMKVVSEVTKRTIVLRDTNRFHHFGNGTCSCKDYW